MDPKRIWAYYLRAAEVTGAPEGEESEGGTQTPFSVRSFFPDSPEGENPLVRAYLGDEAAMDALPWAEGRALAQRLAPKLEEILPNPGLNPAQREAVLQALTAPVTIIQGPPGTGKTETICNLLACIHTLYPERTAAMVSGSNSAVDNVAEKLMKWAIRGGSREKDLLDAFSCFGSAARRKAWLASIGLEEAFRNRQYRPDRAYLDKRPLFTSTIHSLRRCFREADLQFDYVIVDESAQVSCLLGILAMGCAKRLVLLGDPLQLPAVITDRHAAVGREFPDLDPVFMDREGHSFLEACRARFPRAPFVLLNEHYRCHPLIAGFFNRYYGGALKLPPPAEGECPIHIRWYAGDYWETRGMKPVPRQGREFAGIDRQNGRILYRAKAGSETQLRAAYVNERQIAVFLREEWPELQRRLAAEPELTVCVLSPYVYQLHRLKQELERLGAFPALSEGDEEENTLPRLSIHEAQGREYDIVCYLPVEDNYPPEGIPRSQEQRTVNVALSRAVREFRIITAARWLPDGFPERPPEAGEDDRLQLSALIRYALEKGARPVRSGLRSIFDAIPRIRRERSTGRPGSPEDSAPALCLEAALEALGKRPGTPRFRVSREVPLKELVPRELRKAQGPEGEALLRFLTGTDTRADFVLRQAGRPPLVIEVDGAYHRSSPEQALRDRKKDTWLRTALGENGFLRLPTDGTTENEEEIILAKLTETEPRETNWVLVRQELLQHLWRTLNAARDELDKACGFTEWKTGGEGLNTALIRELKALNYTRPDKTDFHYDSLDHNRFYYCRYGVAYAFEYAFLYKALLQDYRLHQPVKANGEKEGFLGVSSFGCGSLLDAWSLAYARAALAAEGAADCGDLKLYYRGSDLNDWALKLLQPHDGQYYRCGSPAEAAPPEVQDTFRNLWLFTGPVPEEQLGAGKQRQDACSHSGDFLQQTQWETQLNYNILTFPKLLNELPPEILDAAIEHLQEAKPKKDLYYLCVSHSLARAANGAAAVDRIIREVFRDFTPYDVLADSADPLMAYLVPQGEQYPYYIFRTDAKDGESNPDLYFSRFNPDFKYNAYKPVFQLIWDLVNELNEPKDPALAKALGDPALGFRHPIVHPSQMAVQLIRLERK